MQETPIFEKAASNKERKIVPILGIFVDSTSKRRALNRACPPSLGELRQGEGKLIVTPNPEIIIAAQKDKSLGVILNKADLALPDGIGVVMAMRYLKMGPPRQQAGRGKGILRPLILAAQGLWVGLSPFFNRKWLFEVSEVVPGRWLFEELVHKAAQEGKRVFLLGGKPGIAAEAAAKFEIRNSPPASGSVGLRRAGKFEIQASAGPWLDWEGKPKDKAETEKETIKQINAFKPHFLFVGFGHPKQEKWLLRNLSKLNVAVAMTVGGAFDYLAGSVPKPPQWLTQAGIEWLWRLLTQPRRIGRIFTAIIVFPIKLYLESIRRQT